MIKKLILLIVVCLCFYPSGLKAKSLCVEDKFCYDVKVMQTIDELEKGLMFVKEMPEKEGMLFDFRPFVKKKISMWMKNTYIGLDMLFIGCDFKIKDIYKNAKPLSLKKIKSESDFCYVLEINSGQSDKHKFVIDDKVDIDFSFK